MMTFRTDFVTGVRGASFTLLELLVLIAIVSIISVIALPLYVSWRADTLHAEATSFVLARVAGARSEAKLAGTGGTQLVFTDGASAISEDGDLAELPGSGSIEVDGGGAVTVLFGPPFGEQSPYQVLTFKVTTGAGALTRTSVVSIIPPLGKAVVE